MPAGPARERPRPRRSTPPGRSEAGGRAGGWTESRAASSPPARSEGSWLRLRVLESKPALPERGVGRLQRLRHNPHEIVTQGIQVGLLAQPCAEGSQGRDGAYALVDQDLTRRAPAKEREQEAARGQGHAQRAYRPGEPDVTSAHPCDSRFERSASPAGVITTTPYTTPVSLTLRRALRGAVSLLFSHALSRSAVGESPLARGAPRLGGR